MYQQLDIFDFINIPKQFKPGDWIEKEFCGKQLSFGEIANSIGKLIVMDKSTSSHEWYKVVLVEKIVLADGNQRRLIYYDGSRQRGLVNEIYFRESITRAFELITDK